MQQKKDPSPQVFASCMPLPMITHDLVSLLEEGGAEEGAEEGNNRKAVSAVRTIKHWLSVSKLPQIAPMLRIVCGGSGKETALLLRHEAERFWLAQKLQMHQMHQMHQMPHSIVQVGDQYAVVGGDGTRMLVFTDDSMDSAGVMRVPDRLGLRVERRRAGPPVVAIKVVVSQRHGPLDVRCMGPTVEAAAVCATRGRPPAPLDDCSLPPSPSPPSADRSLPSPSPGDFREMTLTLRVLSDEWSFVLVTASANSLNATPVCCLLAPSSAAAGGRCTDPEATLSRVLREYWLRVQQGAGGAPAMMMMMGETAAASRC